MTFGFENIYELGKYIDNFNNKCGINNSAFVVYVNGTDFKKIDEDLFFRTKKDDEKYIPSDNEINVNFRKVNIVVKKQTET